MTKVANTGDHVKHTQFVCNKSQFLFLRTSLMADMMKEINKWRERKSNKNYTALYCSSRVVIQFCIDIESTFYDMEALKKKRHLFYIQI